MELNKQQSLEIIVNNVKQKAIKSKYKITTKYKWWCLACLKPIFVSYKQYGRHVIFCNDCYPSFQRKETIAQYQYMRVLKERQIALIEGQLNVEFDTMGLMVSSVKPDVKKSETVKSETRINNGEDNKISDNNHQT